MKKIFFIIIFMTAIYQTYSQEYFIKTFGTTEDDIAINFVQASDSTLLLWGWIAGGGGLLIKTNLVGEQIYLKHIPQITRANDIIKLSDDGFILLGAYNEIIKINSDGIIQWENIPLNYNHRINTKTGHMLDEDHFIVAGDIKVFSHMEEIPDSGIDSIFVMDILVEKYDNTGLLVKRDTIDLGGDIEFSQQILVDNNDIHILCYSYKYNYPNLAIIRLDSNLNLLLDTVYQHIGIYTPYSFAIDEFGNYYVTGTKWISSFQRRDMFVEKISPDGNKIWGTTYDNPFNENGNGYGSGILKKSNGTLSITGGINTAPSINNLVYLNIDSLGNTILYKSYELPGTQGSSSLIELEENKLAIFGQTNYNTLGSVDFLLIVCDSSGNFPLNTTILPLKNSFKIYPNPAINTINVLMPEGNLIKSIRIYDTLGKLVFAQSFNNLNDVRIISMLTKGLYFVIVEDFEGALHSNKLIIN